MEIFNCIVSPTVAASNAESFRSHSFKPISFHVSIEYSISTLVPSACSWGSNASEIKWWKICYTAISVAISSFKYSRAARRQKACMKSDLRISQNNIIKSLKSYLREMKPTSPKSLRVGNCFDLTRGWPFRSHWLSLEEMELFNEHEQHLARRGLTQHIKVRWCNRP